MRKQREVTKQKYKIHLELLKGVSAEKRCIKHLEKIRWPDGIVCPCCNSRRKIYSISRGHNYKCADCKKQFSVRKGTIFAESRLPLTKWFAASWLATNIEEGISSSQLAREIGVTQKTAWFILSRLREVAGTSDGGIRKKLAPVATSSDRHTHSQNLMA